MVGGIKAVAEGLAREFRRLLSGQKTQRNNSALLAATMLEVRSANLTRISRMASILLARIGQLSMYLQWFEACSVTARWTTHRVNRVMVPCGSISTVA